MVDRNTSAGPEAAPSVDSVNPVGGRSRLGPRIALRIDGPADARLNKKHLRGLICGVSISASTDPELVAHWSALM